MPATPTLNSDMWDSRLGQRTTQCAHLGRAYEHQAHWPQPPTLPSHIHTPSASHTPSPLLRVHAHVSPSSILFLYVPKSRRSLELSTRRCFLAHTWRCSRACHSPNSAYDDYDTIAARLGAALRLRGRAGHPAPDLRLDWRMAPRVFPSFRHSLFPISPRFVPSLHTLPSSLPSPTPPSFLLALPSLPPSLPPHLAARCQTTAPSPPHSRASSRQRASHGLAFLARIDEPYSCEPSAPFHSPPSLLSSFDAPRSRAAPTRSRSFSPPPSPCALLLTPATHHSLKLNSCNTHPRRLCTCDPLTPCTRYRFLTPDTLPKFTSAVRPRASDAHPSTARLDPRARPGCVLLSLLPLPISIPPRTPPSPLPYSLSSPISDLARSCLPLFPLSLPASSSRPRYPDLPTPARIKFVCPSHCFRVPMPYGLARRLALCARIDERNVGRSTRRVYGLAARARDLPLTCTLFPSLPFSSLVPLCTLVRSCPFRRPPSSSLLARSPLVHTPRCSRPLCT
ncbi:hypothetical protein DFH08DRAFT_1039402 [Mycena albidolilacea]|uniref:Uncharacterized protein n=1 Tax=Mycena albidolilacea TaxID=1033008 RepID=A0AAD6ZCF0_9AGAR|nr:hypothetical protein DFH08DRAFT_1039402 [Mycena albidolilacea]